MKLATRSGDLASTVMVPNSLGPAELLLHYGTDEQRNHYLPRLARGEDIPCFALTGPLAGSDAGAMTDTGIICKGQWQGEEVIGLRLTLVHQTLLFLLFFADLLGLLLVDQTCLEQLIAKGKAHCLLTYTVTAHSATAGRAFFLTFGFAPQRVHFFERARFDRTLQVAQSLFNESEASVELAIGRA